MSHVKKRVTLSKTKDFLKSPRFFRVCLFSERYFLFPRFFNGMLIFRAIFFVSRGQYTEILHFKLNVIGGLLIKITNRRLDVTRFPENALLTIKIFELFL